MRKFYERRWGPTALSARELGDAAESGDERARAAWQDYGGGVGKALGTALFTTINRTRRGWVSQPEDMNQGGKSPAFRLCRFRTASD